MLADVDKLRWLDERRFSSWRLVVPFFASFEFNEFDETGEWFSASLDEVFRVCVVSCIVSWLVFRDTIGLNRPGARISSTSSVGKDGRTTLIIGAASGFSEHFEVNITQSVEQRLLQSGT